MYTDYAFYANQYHGTMPEASFAVFARRASDEIDIRTFGRASYAPQNMQPRVATACCAIADALFAQDGANGRTANGALKSANNDGYSESYSSAADTDQAAERRICAICVKWLSFPINLMYRGC